MWKQGKYTLIVVSIHYESPERSLQLIDFKTVRNVTMQSIPPTVGYVDVLSYRVVFQTPQMCPLALKIL